MPCYDVNFSAFAAPTTPPSVTRPLAAREQAQDEALDRG